MSEQTIADHSAPLFTALAGAYARRFTRGELTEIRAFVRTPAGAKFLQQSADLISEPEVAQANTDYMTRAFAAMRPAMEELRLDLQETLARRGGDSGSAGSRRPGRRR